jgi:hypothetical protein
MAKVTIGGVEHSIPPLNFKAIKRIWPLISKLDQFNTPTIENGLAAAEIVIEVLAAAFEREHPEYTADWIEENMRADEIPSLNLAIQDLMVESGFAQTTGDTPSGEAKGRKKRSTATSTE